MRIASRSLARGALAAALLSLGACTPKPVPAAPVVPGEPVVDPDEPVAGEDDSLDPGDLSGPLSPEAPVAPGTLDPSEPVLNDGDPVDPERPL